MRFHVLGIPHTVTSKAYSACAFTQKVLKFCKMMHTRGHEVYHYGHEKSIVDAKEHITVMTDDVLKKAYGDYDWRSQMFKHDANDVCHWYFNMKAAEEVTKRKKPGDFLLLFWGIGHSHVAKVHANDMIVVEPGIGSYNNFIAPFCVFESYAVLHYVYAKFNHMPRWMDCVIPNYFDPEDFIDATSVADVKLTDEEWTTKYTQIESTIGETASRLENACTLEIALQAPEGQYALLIGRCIASKGIQVAIEVCHKANIKLIVAGQGTLYDAVTKESASKIEVTSISDPTGVTHVGYIDPAIRAILIARCKFLFMPTLYSEPFGGVNVEAQMSGIPVITTDWGAFSETVDHGRSGYRCRTTDHFLWAVKNVDSLDRKAIRKHAHDTWGLTKVATMYEEYFQMLESTLKDGGGYYKENPGRLALKWLEKPGWPMPSHVYM